jgi:toxin YoeB
LLDNCARSPFDGFGKPEPLKGNLSGYWSRRIDEVNRLVYRANDEVVVVLNCRYHYAK